MRKPPRLSLALRAKAVRAPCGGYALLRTLDHHCGKNARRGVCRCAHGIEKLLPKGVVYEEEVFYLTFLGSAGFIIPSTGRCSGVAMGGGSAVVFLLFVFDSASPQQFVVEKTYGFLLSNTNSRRRQIRGILLLQTGNTGWFFL